MEAFVGADRKICVSLSEDEGVALGEECMRIRP